MYLSVGPGGEPASDFQVTSLQGQRAAGGSPVVAATVTNTGGRALDLGGELSLAGRPGGLSAGPFSAAVGSTLGLNREGPVLVTLDRALPNGPWQANIIVRSGTTVREATGAVTFPDRPASVSEPVATGGGEAGGGAGGSEARPGELVTRSVVDRTGCHRLETRFLEHPEGGLDLERLPEGPDRT